MRLAVISDVHANMEALSVVLERIDEMGVDLTVHAGDVVGYYPFPDQTIQLFRKRGIATIQGEHDRCVVRFNTVGLNRMAAVAARWTSENIRAEHVDFLKGLKGRMFLEADGERIGMFHGTPRDSDEYLYEVDAGAELLEMCGCSIMISGRTHIPFVKRFPDGMVLNPGSVGQPRDGDGRAAFAILDPGKGDCSLHRVGYDRGAVEEAVLAAGLPPFLGERLRYGF